MVYSRKRFEIVDIQNATLSGGVAVGAIADLMLQPYGAFVAGTICGVVSTLGYRIFQVSGGINKLKYTFLPYCNKNVYRPWSFILVTHLQDMSG